MPVRETESILEIRLGLSADGPELGVLRLLIELSAQVVGATEGSLLLVDHSETPPRQLVFAMTVGRGSHDADLRGQSVPLGEGVTGLAAITHAVQIGAPAYGGVDESERQASPAGPPQNLIAAPMLIGDRLVGVITAVSFDPEKRFTSEEAELYGRAASVAGVVVDQRQQLDRLAATDAASATAEQAGERGDGDRIRASVSRLLASGQSAHLARLLETLEAFVLPAER